MIDESEQGRGAAGRFGLGRRTALEGHDLVSVLGRCRVRSCTGRRRSDLLDFACESGRVYA